MELNIAPETEQLLRVYANRIGKPLEQLFCVAMEMFLENLKFPSVAIRPDFSRAPSRDKNSLLLDPVDRSVSNTDHRAIMGITEKNSKATKIVFKERNPEEKKQRPGEGESTREGTLLFPELVKKPRKRPKNKLHWCHGEGGAIMLPEISDPNVRLLLPLKDGSCYPVTDRWLDHCKKAYTGVDVETAVRDAYLYCLNNPQKAPERDGARFLQNWFSREHKKMIRNAEELRAEFSIPRRKGDPMDGETDQHGNKWSEFNRCWMRPEAWASKRELEDVMLGISNSVYGHH